MATVNAANPKRVLASKDWPAWSHRYASKVIRVQGSVEHLNLRAGAFTLTGGLHCFLARNQEKRWQLAPGATVTLKGLLTDRTPEQTTGVEGISVYACVILDVAG